MQGRFLKSQPKSQKPHCPIPHAEDILAQRVPGSSRLLSFLPDSSAEPVDTTPVYQLGKDTGTWRDQIQAGDTEVGLLMGLQITDALLCPAALSSLLAVVSSLLPSRCRAGAGKAACCHVSQSGSAADLRGGISPALGSGARGCWQQEEQLRARSVQ